MATKKTEITGGQCTLVQDTIHIMGRMGKKQTKIAF